MTFKKYVELLAKAWRTSDDLATILEDVVIDLKRYFFHFVEKAML